MLKIPDDYKSILDIRQTEEAIKKLKDFFETRLSAELQLTRVSAPLFVVPESGLNDDLNGVERPVRFGVKDMNDKNVEIIHSLAKWKRYALRRYGFGYGEGLYTDMNAIRRDEELDNVHSIYVDQWDWEKIITSEERTRETLYETVEIIFRVFKQSEEYICSLYPSLHRLMPKCLKFISSQELEDLYPELSGKEREDAITREYGAVFLTQIGWPLKSGDPHDGRAPDYDDWSLNGDLLIYYPVLERAVEVSSMGIRVDEAAMLAQTKKAGCEYRLELDFHKRIMNGELPYTIGGGLGQSRICMLLLNKAHIGEVQATIWPQETLEQCERAGIHLL